MTRQRHPFRPGPAGGKISRTGWANAGLVLFTVLLLVRAPTLRAGTLEPIPDAPPAPALRLADPSGTVHDLSALADSVVLVNFWASWCPPCLTEMPSLDRLAGRLADRGFRVLAVNVGEDPRRAQATLERLGYEGTLLLDRDQSALASWGVKVLPTSFVIGSDGRPRLRVVGDLDWDDKDVNRVIEEMIESPSVPAD